MVRSRLRYAALALMAACGGSLTAATPQSRGAVAAPSSGTQLLFLGTNGGPPLRQDRAEPSTLLTVEGRPYLFDCGIGTIRRMLDAGIQSQTIHTIFFTHLHADHDLGLADVMGNDFFTLNQSGSTQTIAIYGPPQTKDLVDAAFHYITYGFTAFAAEPGAIRSGLVNGALESPFEAHEIRHDGVVFQDDKIRVTAAENSHYVLMPSPARDDMKSYAYRVDTPDGVVVFTGDTGPSDAVTRLAAGADVLVSEVQDEDQVRTFVTHMGEQNHWPPQRTAALLSHMTSEHLGEKDAGELATAAHVGSLVLYHDNSPEDVAGVKKYFTGPVFGAVDLARYCLHARGRLQECASR